MSKGPVGLAQFFAPGFEGSRPKVPGSSGDQGHCGNARDERVLNPRCPRGIGTRFGSVNRSLGTHGNALEPFARYLRESVVAPRATVMEATGSRSAILRLTPP